MRRIAEGDRDGRFGPVGMPDQEGDRRAGPGTDVVEHGVRAVEPDEAAAVDGEDRVAGRQERVRAGPRVGLEAGQLGRGGGGEGGVRVVEEAADADRRARVAGHRQPGEQDERQKRVHADPGEQDRQSGRQ